MKELEMASILRHGLSYKQVSAFDILCLPENMERASNKSELFDASDSIILSKLLKTKGVQCANSYDLAMEAQVLERRSKEKWFGTVYIRNRVVVPIFVTVISTLLTNEVVQNIKNTEQPIPQVHIELKIEKSNKITTLKYDGDSETLLTILKGLEAESDTNISE